MSVQLTFINRSSAVAGADVVVLQKSLIPSLGEIAVAWKVIRYCGFQCRHPFVYTADCEISSSDDWGNHSPRLTARPGQSFAVSPTAIGRRLAIDGAPTTSPDIEVSNELPLGAININLFRNGRLLARKTDVAPQEKAVFRVNQSLWIGVATDVVEGAAVTSAVLSTINTELSMLGVLSADIVMTGGGAGPMASAYAFAMGNVRTA